MLRHICLVVLIQAHNGAVRRVLNQVLSVADLLQGHSQPKHVVHLSRPVDAVCVLDWHDLSAPNLQRHHRIKRHMQMDSPVASFGQASFVEVKPGIVWELGADFCSFCVMFTCVQHWGAHQFAAQHELRVQSLERKVLWELEEQWPEYRARAVAAHKDGVVLLHQVVPQAQALSARGEHVRMIVEGLGLLRGVAQFVVVAREGVKSAQLHPARAELGL